MTEQKLNNKVYLIGAGPGDPGLLTLKGAAAIKMADVVVYDRLSSGSLLDLARPDAELVYVGKAPGKHSKTQEEINQILVHYASQGKTVARVKGGDPFVFGRGGEEAQELVQHNLAYEVVPGVTSAIAAPAYAGIPVTHRDFCASFHVITGNKKDNIENIDFATLAQLKGTLVFLMGVKNLSYIVAELLKYGKAPETPAALVHRGTTCKQRQVAGTLANIVETAAAAGITSPAVIIIGGVVALQPELQWLEPKPLDGKRVAVTRSRAQASELKQKLEALGAEVYQFPLIRIESDRQVLQQAVQQISSCLVFTSQNAVELYFDSLLESKKDVRALAGSRVLAVGSKTAAALAQRGILCDGVPEKFTGEELAKLLIEKLPAGADVQLLRSDIAAKKTADLLRTAGFQVADLAIYKTVMDGRGAEDFIRLDQEKDLDFLTFTSSSTVKNYLKATNNYQPQAKIVCIGEVTAKTATELGLKVEAIADPFTIDGMIAKILELAQ